MAEPNKTPHYLFVVGPTCTGKTDLAIRLAKELQGVIVNSDSVQVYKSVDIGTAKPKESEKLKVPHYLFDIVEEGEQYTLAQYVEDVTDLLHDLAPLNAIFCGGSGFYIQALEKGMYPQVQASEELKKKVDRWIDKKGYEAVHQWIAERDPDCAEALSVNDHYRLRRSMQIMMTQKTTITDLKKKMAKENHSPLPPHKKIKIGLLDEKLNLKERVRKRTQQMLKEGLIEEVEGLLKKGLVDWAPMQSVGYKEVKMHLRDELSKEELEEKIVTSTMQLIKKQMTWFKRDKEIHWFRVDEREKAYDYAMSWAHNEPS